MQQTRRPWRAVALACLAAAATAPLARGNRDDRKKERLQAAAVSIGGADRAGSAVEVSGEAATRGPSAARHRPGDILFGGRFRVLRHLGHFPLLKDQVGHSVLQGSGSHQATSHSLVEAWHGRQLWPQDELEDEFTEVDKLGVGAHIEAIQVTLNRDMFDLDGGSEAVLKLLIKETEVDGEPDPKIDYATRKTLDTLGLGIAWTQMEKECNEAKKIQEKIQGLTTSRFMKCYGTILDDPEHEKQTDDEEQTDYYYYSLVEFVGKYNLLEVAEDRKGLPVDQVMKFTKQILEGLKLLSQMDPPRIHHDVKPDNIVLEDAGERLHIIDYGFMEHATEDLLRSSCKQQGTPGYVPLEAVRRLPYTTSTAYDVYSLGATVMALATGWESESLFDLLTQIIQQKLTIPDSPEFKVNIGDAERTFTLDETFNAEFKNEFGETAHMWQKIPDPIMTWRAYFPISHESGKMYTIEWWLRLLAAILEEGRLLFPFFKQFFDKHKDLLGTMLDSKPENRPTPDQLLKRSEFLT